MKLIYENIEKNKEEIKISIQKVFTKLRNNINDREDELLLNVDKQFNEDFNMELIKESDKLPNKIELSLEKGKLIDINLDNNNNLNLLINDCLNIENNIYEINKINLSIEKIKKFNNKQIKFFHTEEQIKQISEKINKFGLIGKNPLSQIISDDNFKKINEWIGGNNSYILKYNAKVDGCNTDIFHEKCDGISGAIIICKICDGDIIGGYISTKIQKKDEYSDDDKAFIFNLTKNIIKKNKKSYKKAIKNYNDSSYFIRFGSACPIFSLSGKCLTEESSKFYSCGCSGAANFDTDKLSILNQSSKSCKIENFEVFQVYKNI